MPFARDALTVFVYRIILSGVILSADIIVARELGPFGKGAIWIFTVSPAILAALSTGGIDLALNFVGHRTPSDLRRILSTALTTGTVLAAVAAVVVGFDLGHAQSLFFPSADRQHLSWVIASLSITPFQFTFLAVTMFAILLGRPVLASEMRIVRRLIVLVGVIVAVIAFHGAIVPSVLLIVASHAFAAFASSIAGMFRARQTPARSFGSFRALITVAAKCYPGQVAELLQMRVDVVLLGLLGSTASVGMYSVATSIAEVLFYVSNSLEMVLYSRNLTKSEDLFSQATRLMLPASIILASLCGLAATVLIPVVYGHSFAPGITLLWALLPGVVFLSLVHVITPYLIQSGCGGVVSTGQVLGMTTNIACNLLLIPRIGALGASLASSCSYALTFIILCRYARKVARQGWGGMLLPRRADAATLHGILKRMSPFATRS